MREGSMVGMADIFPCFLSPFGREASTSYADKLGQAGGGSANARLSQAACWVAK